MVGPSHEGAPVSLRLSGGKSRSTATAAGASSAAAKVATALAFKPGMPKRSTTGKCSKPAAERQ